MTVTRGAFVASALGLLSTSLLLAGCNSSAPMPSPPSESAAPSSSAEAAPSVAPSPVTVTVTASPVAPSGGSTAGGSPTAAGACSTGQLTVRRVDRGGSGMMKSDNSLQFTNVSATPCTLHGFPKVTAVGANGVTLTKPATQEGTASGPVKLAPHGTAVAPMLITNSTAYDPGQCTPVPAKGLRIYPPGQNTALFLAQDFTVCSGSGPNLMRTESITK